MLELLTSANLLGSEDEMGLYVKIACFSVGLLVHILRQMWSEEVTFKEYLLTHKARSIMSLGSLASIFVLITTTYPDSPLLVYFLCGYSVDSLVNKAPLTSRKIGKETIL